MPLHPQTAWPVVGSVQARPLLNAFKTLKKKRPRLLWNASDRPRILKLIKTSPEAKAVYAKLLEQADTILSAPNITQIMKERTNDPKFGLWDARAICDRVYTLGFLHLLTGDKKYTSRAKAELLATAALESWTTEYDMVNSEVLHAMAIGLDWLDASWSRDERETMQRAIYEKGLLLAEIAYAVRPWWLRDPCNWNTVLHGAVVIGALSMGEVHPLLCAHLLANAVHHVPSSMVTFAPDGGWPEGAGYWSFQSRYLTPMISCLESALGENFGLDKYQGLAGAGSFRCHMEGPFGHYFNFSDTYLDAIAEPCLFWYSNRFKKPYLAYAARRSMSGKPATYGTWARALMMWNEAGNEKVFNAQPRHAWYRGVDVMAMRSAWSDKNAWYVGIKGGDVQANHGQCDLGSFILDALGTRWVMDFGGENYAVPGYFDGRPDKGYKRWQYYRMQALGHNTLIVDGKNHHLLSTAPALGFSSDKTGARGVIDLGGALRDAPVSRAWRGIEFLDKGPSVLIQDEVDLTGPAQLASQFHTQAQVEISGNSVVLKKDGQSIRVEMQSSTPGEWKVEEIDLKPPMNPTPNTRKVSFVVAAGKGTHTLTCRFGEAGRTKIKPIKRWKLS